MPGTTESSGAGKGAAMSERKAQLAEDGFVADRAIYYAALYPSLREVAREHGYALALHGSLQKDLDVVAVPWIEGASSERLLVRALTNCAGGVLHQGRTKKPHMRAAYTIELAAQGGYVDLSVLARESAAPGESDAD